RPTDSIPRLSLQGHFPDALLRSITVEIQVAFEVTEIGPLEHPPQNGWHEPADGIVAPLPRRRAPSRRAPGITDVTLQPEIIDDLRWVEGYTKKTRLRGNRRCSAIKVFDQHR